MQAHTQAHMQVHSHKTAAMQAHLHKPLHHLLKGVLRLNKSLDSANSSSSAGKDLVIQVAILRGLHAQGCSWAELVGSTRQEQSRQEHVIVSGAGRKPCHAGYYPAGMHKLA